MIQVEKRDSKQIDIVKGIKIAFTPKALIESNSNFESRVISIEGKDYMLKIINKSRHSVKERKHNMTFIKSLIGLRHPNIACLKFYFMSTNHQFFITEMDDPTQAVTGIPGGFQENIA
jgi:hypothetical protein